MSNVLHLDSSMRTEGSITRQLSAEIVAKLGADSVTTRDLLSTPAKQIDETWIGANFTAVEERTEEQKQALEVSDALIKELQDNDVIVIGLPIYNFGVPAALKAWVDLICRAGVTFSYTENGPQGLLEGKRAIVAVASGGVPIDSPADFATPYIKFAMNFIGISDVTVIAAPGAGGDPESLAAAQAQIEQLSV